jgi:hypothetical protein
VLYTSITIVTVDTDVVVIAISKFSYLSQLGLETLWIEYATGKHKKWLPVHTYVNNLGPDKCDGMLFWYAFTGCDTVSIFSGIGKSTAWKTWDTYNDATPVFKKLSLGEFYNDADISTIERYTCLLYSRTTTHIDVNKCRRELFTNGGRMIQNVPPCKDSLEMHMKRAIYQAG